MWVKATDGDIVNLDAATKISMNVEGDGTVFLLANGKTLVAAGAPYANVAVAQAAVAAMLGTALVTI